MTVPHAQAFHAHLDSCARCQSQPFNLCETGAQLLCETVGSQPDGKATATKEYAVSRSRSINVGDVEVVLSWSGDIGAADLKWAAGELGEVDDDEDLE